jgi:DNA invertase Pin-like site-specific DNA recombinase
MPQPVLHPYVRISDPSQRKGGGLERQTSAAMAEFCHRFGFTLSKRIWVDDGVSAWKGLNATPDHELGKFLLEAKRGSIRPGDCLLVENWDRLSRQNPWAAVALANDVRELGIHLGRLDRMKLLRCDSTDPGDFFDYALEAMRGHSESEAKSMRNGAAWQRKRRAARQDREIITRRLPAWIEVYDGKLRLIPERAAIVKRIFALAASGHGNALIVKRLTEERVPALGPSGHWVRSYVALILRDRRCLGEFQPRGRNGAPEGDVIKDYFPRVVSDDEWDAARGAATQRRRKPGRQGKHINVFAGLLKDALGGGSYYCTARRNGQPGRYPPQRILVNTEAVEGRAPMRSFPFATFETAVLSLLREIDPHEILNGDSGPDESLVLAGQLAGIESELAEASAFMEANGFSPTIGKRVTELEARKRAVAERLAEARHKAAHPLSEAWGEAQGLLSTLETATDQNEARLRLKAALGRMVEGIMLLVVARGRDRLTALQIWFSGGQRHRDYLILHRPPYGSATTKRSGGWGARSLAEIVRPGKRTLDLRKPEHAEDLAALLAQVDMQQLAAALGVPST